MNYYSFKSFLGSDAVFEFERCVMQCRCRLGAHAFTHNLLSREMFLNSKLVISIITSSSSSSSSSPPPSLSAVFIIGLWGTPLLGFLHLCGGGQRRCLHDSLRYSIPGRRPTVYQRSEYRNIQGCVNCNIQGCVFCNIQGVYSAIYRVCILQYTGCVFCNIQGVYFA